MVHPRLVHSHLPFDVSRMRSELEWVSRRLFSMVRVYSFVMCSRVDTNIKESQ